VFFGPGFCGALLRTTARGIFEKNPPALQKIPLFGDFLKKVTKPKKHLYF